MNDARSQNGEPLSPVKRAIVELRELRARLDECERRNSEPIALVGIGCRFPGGADAPESFWHLLRDGVDAVTEIPADRWDREALYDPYPDAPGKMSTRWGGFLRRRRSIRRRILRDLAARGRRHRPATAPVAGSGWEALEDAGHAPERLFGSRPASSSGIASIDYAVLQAKSGSTELMDAYYATGFSHSVAIRTGRPMSLASRDRPSRSTRPARRRWWRSTWPARACGPASATWPWPAAST